MRPLAADEVRPPAVYEAVRAEALHDLLAQRSSRSIAVGDLIALLFENRVTVAGALEEQLRAAQIEEPGRIAAEVEVFNALLPGERELTATLFLDCDDPAEAGRRMRDLPGLSAHVHLEVDGSRVERVETAASPPEAGDETVALLRFRLSEDQCAAVERGGEVVALCDHPGHRARTVLDDAQRRALAEDLGR
ncbi:MAG: DUF3501 family protein [Chloroflexi bacterium]|nr:MAG: DUF3501 family protein [Chloroflexota bacterium]